MSDEAEEEVLYTAGEVLALLLAYPSPDAEIERLTVALLEVEQERNIAQSQVQALDEGVAALRAANAELRAWRDQAVASCAKRECSRIPHRIQELLRRAEELQAAAEYSAEERSDELDVLSAQIETLTSELRAKQETLEEVVAQHARERHEAQQSVDHWQEMAGRYGRERDEARKQLNEAQRELDVWKPEWARRSEAADAAGRECYCDPDYTPCVNCAAHECITKRSGITEIL